MRLTDWRCAFEGLEDCILVIGGLYLKDWRCVCDLFLKDWRCVFEGMEVCS